MGRDYNNSQTNASPKTLNTNNTRFLTGFTCKLPDGEPVWFRPVRTTDSDIIRNGLSTLSIQSRYQRFFTPISSLSASQLQHLTRIDQINHVAWIALSQSRPEQPGLGIGRFVRLPEQPGIAELAMVVIDSHQHKGVGTYLLAVLCLEAQAKAVETLRAFVLPDNTVMSHWFGRLGASGIFENGVYRMDLVIPGDLWAAPASPAEQKLREAIVQIC